MMLKSWLQHAFAVNPTTGDPSSEQLAVVDKLCREVVRRKLTVPATAFLEMSRPLNYIGSQSLHFFSPLISAIARGEDHLHLAAFLERRDAIDRICDGIEAIERAAKEATPAANTVANDFD